MTAKDRIVGNCRNRARKNTWEREPEQNIPVSDGKQAPREGTDQLLNEDKDRWKVAKSQRKDCNLNCLVSFQTKDILISFTHLHTHSYDFNYMHLLGCLEKITDWKESQNHILSAQICQKKINELRLWFLLKDLFYYNQKMVHIKDKKFCFWVFHSTSDSASSLSFTILTLRNWYYLPLLSYRSKQEWTGSHSFSVSPRPTFSFPQFSLLPLRLNKITSRQRTKQMCPWTYS